MGLDMYLSGDKYLPTKFNVDEPDNIYEDGFRVKSRRLELGYWRKHPNLHEFIVNTFADGVDKCQENTLTTPMIEEIIEAIKNQQLPDTKGFLFVHSDDTETNQDLEIFTKALDWLNVEEVGVWRSVKYRASW